MTIYNEAGRGRKQCPKCEKYLGVMSKECENCGETFDVNTRKAGTTKPKIKPKTFRKPSKGRKPCPVCHGNNKPIFVGTRTSQCPVCDHTFEKKEQKTVEPNIFDSPGKGRKECPDCDGVFVGTRTSTCPVCKHNFKAVSTKPKNVGTIFNDVPWDVISTPKGKCPIALQKTDEESVKEWVDKIKEHGKRTSNEFYTIRALQYWVRQYIEFGTDEYNLSKEIIKGYASDDEVMIPEVTTNDETQVGAE